MPAPFSRTTRALATDSPRGALLAWLLAGLALLAWLLWFTAGSVQVVELSRRARLEARAAPQPLTSDLSGRVLASRLQLGQRVQAGEVLVTLDSSRLALQWREERSRLDTVAPRLAALRDEIAASTAAMDRERQAAGAAQQAAQARLREQGSATAFATDNERRLQAEHRGGGVAEIDALRASADASRQRAAGQALGADLRRLALDSQARAQQALAQLGALRRSLATLQGEEATGQATLTRLAADIDRHQLRAPVAGVVGEAAAIAPGQLLADGQRLATIIPDGELLIVAAFEPGTALGRLQPGQAATLRLDGFPWAQYGSVAARVQRVSAEVRDQLLRVELQPLPPALGATPPPLRHGLAGQVEVVTEYLSPARLLLRVAGQVAASAGNQGGHGGGQGGDSGHSGTGNGAGAGTVSRVGVEPPP